MISRVLIVGYGSIGQRHLRIVRESIPDADIRVLRHQPSETIPEFADGCFSRIEDACAFEPQVALIANPSPFHVATAGALLGVGTHLLVEKPLANSVNGIAALLQQASGVKAVFQVGYNLRFLPSLGKFREILQAGKIGRVLSVRCEIGQYLPSWRPNSDYRVGVSARQDLGGGALLELSHEIDYLRWIFGNVAWLTAYLGHQSALEIDVEDTAHLLLGFEAEANDGALVASLNIDFIRHDTTRLCTAIGESGSLRWNGLTGEVEFRPAGSAKWILLFHHLHERDESYRAQWLHFLGCVNTGDVPLVTAKDGAAVLDIIDAARQSASALGARIDVKNT